MFFFVCFDYTFFSVCILRLKLLSFFLQSSSTLCNYFVTTEFKRNFLMLFLLLCIEIDVFVCLSLMLAASSSNERPTSE